MTKEPDYMQRCHAIHGGDAVIGISPGGAPMKRDFMRRR
jgi:hypothetical protein